MGRKCNNPVCSQVVPENAHYCRRCGQPLGLPHTAFFEIPAATGPVVRSPMRPTLRMPCPHCGNQVKVPPEHMGRRGRCPHCEQSIVLQIPPSAW